jgi:hypothetical protein
LPIFVNLRSALLSGQAIDFGLCSFDARVQAFHLLEKSVIEGIYLGIMLKSVLQILALSVHDQPFNIPLFLSNHILDVLVDCSVFIASSAQIRSSARRLNLPFRILDISQEKIGIVDSHAFLGLPRFCISQLGKLTRSGVLLDTQRPSSHQFFQILSCLLRSVLG